MDAIKEFLTGSTLIANTPIPNWAFVVAGVVVLALIIVIICVAASKGKKKKAQKAATPVVERAPKTEEKAKPVEEKKEEPVVAAAQPVEEVKEPEPVVEAKEPEPVVEEKKEEPAPVVEEKKEEPAPAVEEKPVEEKKPVEKKAPVAKKAPVVEKKQEVVEEPKKTGPVVKRNDNSQVIDGRRSRMSGRDEDAVFGKGVVEETVVAPVAEKKTAKKPAAPVKEEKPAAPVKEEKPAPAVKEEKAPAVEKEVAASTADGKKGAIGKFEICNSSIGGFRYLLLANNGQLLYESRDYKTFDGCRDAIDKFVKAVKAGDFRVRGDKFGNFKYNLKSPTSNNVVFIGESYDTKKKCESAVESVKRFAETAKIVDITEADFVATSATFDIPEDVKSDVADGKGATGKWEITTADDGENSPFVYLLYANNGQLLYESRDYKTFDSCRSGLDTFLKTIKDGEFIVDSDKFGRYRFILRKAGNQVEYVGQNYNDKQSAIRSAVSVYKFALLTPVELN